MQNKYHVDMLYAHLTVDTSDDLGLMDQFEILKLFDQIDWYEQAEISGQKEEFSATLSVEYPDKTKLFWASVIGIKDSIEFLVYADLEDIEVNKKFLGLFSYKSSINSFEEYFNQQQTRHILELFMNNENRRIYELYIQKK